MLIHNLEELFQDFFGHPFSLLSVHFMSVKLVDQLQIWDDVLFIQLFCSSHSQYHIFLLLNSFINRPNGWVKSNRTGESAISLKVRFIASSMSRILLGVTSPSVDGLLMVKLYCISGWPPISSKRKYPLLLISLIFVLYVILYATVRRDLKA